MASLRTMPDDILRLIFLELKSSAESSEHDPAFFTATYVCQKFRICALEILHKQNSIRWSKKTRTRKTAALRKAEALTLFERYASKLFCCGWYCEAECNKKIFEVENFTRTSRVYRHISEFSKTAHVLCDRAWRFDLVRQDNLLEQRIWNAFKRHHCHWD